MITRLGPPVEPRRVRSLLKALSLNFRIMVPLSASLLGVDVSLCATIGVPSDYASIQSAIGAAAIGDTVRVEPGTYAETIDFVGKSVAVMGTNPENWSVVESTVLDGSVTGGSVVTFASEEPAAAVLKGLLIRGGTGTFWELPEPGRAGGGIYCASASPTIERCIVRGNVAEGGREHGRGGGIYCAAGANPLVQDCIIEDNQSLGDAGGVFCFEASPTLLGCTVAANECVDSGAGIYCRGSAAPLVENCVVNGNISHDSGGGVYCKEGATPTFRGCTISNNTAVESGGGIKCKTGATPWIVDCEISANAVTRGGADTGGGGLYCIEASPVITRCLVTGNRAIDYGGGISCVAGSNPLIQRSVITGNHVERLDGGGIYSHRSTPVISRCEVTDNDAPRSGGGVACANGSSVVIRNCTISRNQAAEGGAVHAGDARVEMTNCTLADNVASSEGGGLYSSSQWLRDAPDLRGCILWANTPDDLHVGAGVTSVAHSDVGGGAPGEGNQNVDPHFRGGGDYRLSSVSCGSDLDSPAIDGSDPLDADTEQGCSSGLGGERADQGAYGGPGSRKGGDLDVFLVGVPVEVLRGESLELQMRVSNRCAATRTVDRVELQVTGAAQLVYTVYDGAMQPIQPGVERTATLDYTLPQRLAAGTYVLTLRAERGGVLLDADARRMHVPDSRHVPGDHSSIGAAIAAAVDGDVIVVAPGTYAENSLDFMGKAIEVRSRAPEDADVVAATVVDAGGQGSVVRFVNAEGSDTVISGLTLRGGAAPLGGGVMCSGASPTLSRCVIRDNVATVAGGGVHVSSGKPRVELCTLSANTAPVGAGFCGSGTEALIVNSRMTGNVATGDGGGVRVEGGGQVSILGSIIDGNVAGGVGGGLQASGSTLLLENCTVSANEGAQGGGGLAVRDDAAVRVHNSILWADTPDEIDGSVTSVTWSNVAGGWEGEGNRELDPRFTTLDDLEFFLDASSRCIDNGDPDVIDSFQWPFSFGNKPPSDMGAYGGPAAAEWVGAGS